MKKLYKILIYILFSLLLLTFFVYTLERDVGKFTTLDESTNYLVTKEYALSQKFYLENQYLQYDSGNNLHSRGFITFENKLVPFTFLGIPLFYGPLYLFLEDNLRIITIFFMFISIVCTFLIIKTLSKDKIHSLHWVAISFFFSLPAIYFFLKPFHNVVPAITFYLLFLLFVIRFNKNKNLLDLYIALFFSLIGIWFRYEYLLFVILFLFLNILKNKEVYFSINNKLKTIMVIVLIGIFTFIVPLMIINYQLYGDPLTYGYSLFTKTYFEGERTGSVGKQLVNIFFPSQTFNLEVLKNNLLTLFLISPLFSLVFFLTIFKHKNYKKIGLYWLLIIYVIVYSGTSDTFLSGSNILTLNKAFLRYWMIIAFSMIPLAVLFFQDDSYNKKIKIFVIFILIIHSSAFLSDELVFETNLLNRYDSTYSKLIEKVSMKPYILTARDDKFLAGVAHPIVWTCNTWEELKCISDIDYLVLSKLIENLIENGEEVYVRKNGFFNDRLLINFEEYGIRFDFFDKNFYKAKLVSGEER